MSANFCLIFSRQYLQGALTTLSVFSLSRGLAYQQGPADNQATLETFIDKLLSIEEMP